MRNELDRSRDEYTTIKENLTEVDKQYKILYDDINKFKQSLNTEKKHTKKLKDDNIKMANKLDEYDKLIYQLKEEIKKEKEYSIKLETSYNKNSNYSNFNIQKELNITKNLLNDSHEENKKLRKIINKNN